MFNRDSKAIKKALLTNIPLGAGADYFLAYLMNTAPHLKEYLNTRNNHDPAELYQYLIHPIENIQLALSNQTYNDAQIWVLAATAAMIVKDLYEGRKGKYEDRSRYGAHGTSRWAKKREVYKKIMKEPNLVSDINQVGKFIGYYGNFFSKRPVIQSMESQLNRNNLIVGGSGAGKTASHIIPNILHNRESSIVVTDPKGELYEKTSEAKRKQGYDVKLVNFKDTKISDRYNPFDYIKEETDAKKVAQTIIMNSGGNSKELKGDFWDKAEISLLSAFILYIKYTRPKEEHHFGSVFNLATESYKNVHRIFRQLPKNHIGYRSYAQAIEKLDDKVRANVFISLLVSLDLWKYHSVCEFTQKSDFLLGDIGLKKTIVYVILPIAEEELRPLISTFFTQLFSELYSLADKHFNKLPVPVILELDEFANIGKLPNFEERLSTTRSYGIAVDIVIQSLAQLRDRYGKEKANEIIDNCDFVTLLGTKELESAKYFSELTGKTTVGTHSESETFNRQGNSAGESQSVQGRPLMLPDEILRMDKNKALLFMNNSYPIELKKAWYFKLDHFKNMMGEQVSRFKYPNADRSQYHVFDPEAYLVDLFTREPSLPDEEPERVTEDTILKDYEEKTTLAEIMKAVEEDKKEEEPKEEEPKEEESKEEVNDEKTDTPEEEENILPPLVF
ncbi:VirD4-like conjugal transfer protein, CD1115 family [Fictibacillus sp. NRS-1165]|uniref:VirD4-like conjugal transfer protein, CD1115 family n=1 Tax=Fictibacillus sp. NRS-1165 TaxID=3144463 RepID=UPI003D222615